MLVFFNDIVVPFTRHFEMRTSEIFLVGSTNKVTPKPPDPIISAITMVSQFGGTSVSSVQSELSGLSTLA